jgi:hypothetical protein
VAIPRAHLTVIIQNHLYSTSLLLCRDKARSEWCIGSKGGGGARVFVGHIADVQLWSVPLTQAHVTALVADQGSSIPRPVARWMLDDEGGGKQAQVCSGSYAAGHMQRVICSGSRCAAALPFFDLRFQDSSASIDPCHANLKGTASIKPASIIKTNDSASSSSASGAGSATTDRRLCVLPHLRHFPS